MFTTVGSNALPSTMQIEEIDLDETFPVRLMRLFTSVTPSDRFYTSYWPDIVAYAYFKCAQKLMMMMNPIEMSENISCVGMYLDACLTTGPAHIIQEIDKLGRSETDGRVVAIRNISLHFRHWLIHATLGVDNDDVFMLDRSVSPNCYVWDDESSNSYIRQKAIDELDKIGTDQWIVQPRLPAMRTTNKHVPSWKRRQSLEARFLRKIASSTGMELRAWEIRRNLKILNLQYAGDSIPSRKLKEMAAFLRAHFHRRLDPLFHQLFRMQILQPRVPDYCDQPVGPAERDHERPELPQLFFPIQACQCMMVPGDPDTDWAAEHAAGTSTDNYSDWSSGATS